MALPSLKPFFSHRTILKGSFPPLSYKTQILIFQGQPKAPDESSFHRNKFPSQAFPEIFSEKSEIWSLPSEKMLSAFVPDKPSPCSVPSCLLSIPLQSDTVRLAEEKPRLRPPVPPWTYPPHPYRFLQNIP